MVEDAKFLVMAAKDANIDIHNWVVDIFTVNYP